MFVLRQDLPITDPDQLDAWILAAFGSPDRREIDGVCGADLTTTKFAMLSPSTRAGTDVDYSFSQVGIDRPVVGRDANCGNISAAVGPFAIETGLASPGDGKVTVTIHNTNTDRPIYSTLEVRNGRAVAHGDFHIDGVPGTGAPIRLDFRDCTGGRTGSLLPTGHVRDTFEVADLGEVEASVVDIGNLVVFADAKAFGLTATEDFVSLVAPPQGWIDYATREKRAADNCDFVVRGSAVRRAHQAYFGTGSACTAVAAALPGTVVNDVTRKHAIESGVFRLGHPTGTITVEAAVTQSEGTDGYQVRQAQLPRTARKLMDGRVYVSADRLRAGRPCATADHSPNGGRALAGGAERGGCAGRRSRVRWSVAALC